MSSYDYFRTLFESIQLTNFSYIIHCKFPLKFYIFLHLFLTIFSKSRYQNQGSIQQKMVKHQRVLQVSLMAQAMQVGFVASHWGVMRSRQESWKVWPQGRTAAGGALLGIETGPSSVNERSLLHMKQLCPSSWGFISGSVRRSSLISFYQCC